MLYYKFDSGILYIVMFRSYLLIIILRDCAPSANRVICRLELRELRVSVFWLSVPVMYAKRDVLSCI
jgi:hypothetical protein